MTLEYWELKHAPSEGDTDSWQLKLKIPASELISFLNNLPGIIGEPSKIEEAEFNFRVFIYEVKPGIFPLITDYLKEKCPIGEIYDKTKKGAFESILDDLAQSLDTLKGLNNGKEKDVEIKPAETDAKPATKEPPEARESASAPRASAEQNDQLSYKDISDIFNVNYNPQYTFGSYTASKAQEATLDTIKSVANNPGTVYNPFFIQSGPGTGKTHILHAVAQQAHLANSSLNIFFIDPELFIAKMSNSFKDGSLFYAKRYFLRSDVLLVDNIELFKESVIYQKQLASIFRYLLELKKQIIITSRLPKEQLNFLDSKLFELVSSSHSVIMDVPDTETRLDIFKKILKASNMNIEAPQSSYVAPKLPSNYRSMEAFVKRLKLYTSIKNDPLTNEILDKALSEVVASSSAAEPAAIAAPAPTAATPEAVPAPAVAKPVAPAVPVSEPVAAAPVTPAAAPAPEPLTSAATAVPEPGPAHPAPVVPVAEPVKPLVQPAASPAPVQSPVVPITAPVSMPEPVAAPVPPTTSPDSVLPAVPVAAPIAAPIQMQQAAAPVEPPVPSITDSPAPIPTKPASVPAAPSVVQSAAEVPMSPATTDAPVSIPPIAQTVPAPAVVPLVQPAIAAAPPAPPAASAPVPAPPPATARAAADAPNKKVVKIGLFYPAGYYIEAVSLRDNFKSCLTAHKFNFVLDFVFLQQYTSGDFPYKVFSDVCVRNDAVTAVVLGFLKSNLSSSNIPSIEEIKMYLNRDPINKSIFFEFIDSKQAGTDKPCLQYVLDIAISKDLK